MGEAARLVFTAENLFSNCWTSSARRLSDPLPLFGIRPLTISANEEMQARAMKGQGEAGEGQCVRGCFVAAA